MIFMHILFYVIMLVPTCPSSVEGIIQPNYNLLTEIAAVLLSFILSQN